MQQRRCSPVQWRRRCKSSSYFVPLFWRWFAALRQTMSREKLTKLVQRRKFERKKITATDVSRRERKIHSRVKPPESMHDNKALYCCANWATKQQGSSWDALLAERECITTLLLLALDEAKAKEEKRASPWIFTARTTKPKKRKRNLKKRS